MQDIIYVDEYQPSCAKCMVGQDPIYKVSGDTEQIYVRRLVAPSPLIWAVPILAIGGLLLYLVLKK